MAASLNTGARDVPLKFARELSAIVNHEWESGGFITKATPVTQDLLRFWFNDVFCDARSINFHDGQKQAILNAIYLHEIAKTDSVADMYASINPPSPPFDKEGMGGFAAEMDIAYLKKDKFSHPKYCLKMATGTGKTWVLRYGNI
jgi:type III restriction enzyme